MRGGKALRESRFYSQKQEKRESGIKCGSEEFGLRIRKTNLNQPIKTTPRNFARVQHIFAGRVFSPLWRRGLAPAGVTALRRVSTLAGVTTALIL